MGTVTTGEAGTEAFVTNSGTPYAAVFDFTIPKGDTGATGCMNIQLLSAYSTPSQFGTNNTDLIFDNNSVVVGDAISHETPSSEFIISETGIYSVEFHGDFTPIAGEPYPLTLTVTINQDDVPVGGAAAVHVFPCPSGVTNIAFTTPIKVDNLPTTIKVVGDASKFTYTNVGLSIYQVAQC